MQQPDEAAVFVDLFILIEMKKARLKCLHCTVISEIYRDVTMLCITPVSCKKV